MPPPPPPPHGAPPPICLNRNCKEAVCKSPTGTDPRFDAVRPKLVWLLSQPERWIYVRDPTDAKLREKARELLYAGAGWCNHSRHMNNWMLAMSTHIAELERENETTPGQPYTPPTVAPSPITPSPAVPNAPNNAELKAKVAAQEADIKALTSKIAALQVQADHYRERFEAVGKVSLGVARRKLWRRRLGVCSSRAPVPPASAPPSPPPPPHTTHPPGRGAHYELRV